MRAIMLAAGTGSRLSGNDASHPPKSLLTFGGKSLLRRHIEILQAHGVAGLTLVVGYRADEIAAEIAAIGAGGYVTTVRNDRFTEGSVVSLKCASATLTAGDDILFMDADVLYHPKLIAELAAPSDRDVVPYDRGFEEGDEPVKLCLSGGRAVEFRKRVEVDFETVGEWPGFVRWTPASAARLAGLTARFDNSGRADQPYEETFREIMLDAAPGAIDYRDVTGVPWIEIDFADDVVRAETEVLPAIAAYRG